MQQEKRHGQRSQEQRQSQRAHVPFSADPAGSAGGPFGTEGSIKAATVQTARRERLCPHGRAAAGTRSALLGPWGPTVKAKGSK